MPPEAETKAPAILIVEDNQVNALILSAMLRKQGYAPEVARSGAEGVEMTGRHRPRLILMDLQMPRLDGFATASEIRRVCGDVAPVIVAVTANTGASVAAACADSGFAGVLAKPIIYEELASTVRRCLEPA